MKLSETVRTEEESDDPVGCEAGVYVVGLGPENESEEDVCWIGDDATPPPVAGSAVVVAAGGSNGLGV